MNENQSWKQIELVKYVPDPVNKYTDKECIWGVVEQADDNWALFINTPGGMLTPQELKVITGIMENGGIGIKLSSRQAPVLLLPEDKVDDALRKLAAAGLKLANVHGSLRNIKACLGKGNCKNSRQHDVLALARAIDQAFYGVKLPWDFKIGISGCSRNCAAAKCQCLGLVDNRDGFAVYIGGAENELTPVHGTLIATGVPGENVNVVVEIILKNYVYFAHKLIADGIVSAKPRLYEIIGKAGVGYFAQAVKAALYPDTGTTMMEEVPIELAPKDEVAAAMEKVTRLPGFTKENAFSAFIVLNQICIHCLECQRYKCQVFIAKESIVGVSRTGQKFLSQIPTDILDIIRTLPMKKHDGFKIHEAFHTVSETCDHCRVVEHDLLCAVNVALTSLGCLINGRDYETYMDIQKKLLAK